METHGGTVFQDQGTASAEALRWDLPDRLEESEEASVAGTGYEPRGEDGR